MASNPPAQCCTVGIKWEGEPTGKNISIGPYAAYLATPSSSSSSSTTPNHPGIGILYIPDVIGIWTNSCLIADQYAANGYLTLIIDVFNGDALSLNRPNDFNLMEWLKHGRDGKGGHTEKEVDPIVKAGIDWLMGEGGCKKLGGVGYCFGAKYVARHYPSLSTAFFAHPSFVTDPELRSFKGPISIAAAETDQIFTTALRHKSEDILQESGQPYQINLYSGTEHGFGVRGDPKIKVQRFAKEMAFLQAVRWFDTWLLDADDEAGK